MKVVSIFGVTGSIGSQALDFIRSHDNIFSFHTFVCDKNFKLADEIRDKLKEMGVSIEDSNSGTKWRVD